MMEEFKPWVINYDKDKQFLSHNAHSRTDVDDSPHGRVADQLEMDEFHYEIQHHLYHAECGYFYSPWKEKEPAIAITMDGGGAKMHQEDWVDYQEVETIFRCEPNKAPQRQWGRLSNNRAVEEYQNDISTIQRKVRYSLKTLPLRSMVYHNALVLIQVWE